LQPPRAKLYKKSSAERGKITEKKGKYSIQCSNQLKVQQETKYSHTLPTLLAEGRRSVVIRGKCRKYADECTSRERGKVEEETGERGKGKVERGVRGKGKGESLQ